jgi:hypothetical protein
VTVTYGDGDGDGEGHGVDPEALLSGPDTVIAKSDYSAPQSPGLVLSLRSRFVTELCVQYLSS